MQNGYGIVDDEGLRLFGLEAASFTLTKCMVDTACI
jgi:hypothetical protein